MTPETVPAESRSHAESAPSARELRLWFVFYVCWMTGLCAIALWSQERHDMNATGAERIWLGAVYVFYMSLCCTFFPAPTAWIVMLLASQDARLVDPVVPRVLTVTTIGALATAIANLGEYHVWTVLLGFQSLGRVRNTRLFRWARGRFLLSPFAVLVGFSFIPIPVDVVRWLAVACRYSRPRFFLAYFCGRWVRYGLLTLGTVWLDLRWWHILIIQGIVVLAAAVRVALAVSARRASVSEVANEPDVLCVQ